MVYKQYGQSLLEYTLVVAAIIVGILMGAKFIKISVQNHLLEDGVSAKIEEQANVLVNYIGKRNI